MEKDYKLKIQENLKKDFQRKALDKFAKAYKEAREKVFEGIDVYDLKKRISDIKLRSIKSFMELFYKFKKEAEKRGAKVYFAEDALKAKDIILSIARKREAHIITKSKSMTAEEIYLNDFLKKNGFEVIETDLGEWIIQLREEGPSHMVMPAIHLSRKEVAKLFSSKLNIEINQDSIEDMVRVARKVLREKFAKSDIGITGANFAIAESGSIGIVSNEGNARLVATLPKTHVVLLGIDKLVWHFEDALTILKGLTRNATAQEISTYVSWISGSVEQSNIQNKHKDLHIIFLDNGRLSLAEDEIFRDVLKCVRCGACANVCPIYKLIGGHAFGHIYIGAIGLVLTYFYHGIEKAKDLIENCLNCHACKEICIANIDLPNLIIKLRSRIKKELKKDRIPRFVGTILKNRKIFHSIIKTVKCLQAPLKDNEGYIRHLPYSIINPKEFRKLPALAKTPFRDQFFKIKKSIKNPKYKVALFTGCLQDFVYTNHLKKAVIFLQKHNVEVNLPLSQGCCGLPIFMMGEEEITKDIAVQNVKSFDLKNYDFVITLCASCASHIKTNYPALLKDLKEVSLFCEKLLYFTTFINKYLLSKINLISKKQEVSYHAPCHLSKVLKEHINSLEVLNKLGYELVIYGDEEVCCGLGGSYSFKFPEISYEIVKEKLEKVKEKSKILITDCPGCVLQLEGTVKKNNLPIKVLHFAELLDCSNFRTTSR